MRLFTKKAHGIQIMKTCEALKKEGVDVELWVASSGRNFKQKVEITYGFYGIKSKFPIKPVPVLDFLPQGGKLNFYFRILSFLISCFFVILKSRENFIIYTRDEIILFLSFFTKRKMFWESHMTLRSNFLAKSRMRKIAGIIAISDNLKNIISRKYNVDSRKIKVAHDAVDLDKFDNFLSITEARRSLGLPQDKNIVVYAGSIFKQKGIFVLLEAATLLDEKWLFVIVGGNQGDESEKAKKFVSKKGLKNVIFKGYVPHKEINTHLAAADILVIPNSNLDERTRLFTSPLKLFEYMASGRPIVASATPTILEVLNDPSTGSGQANAILVEPDNPTALKEGFLEISNDKKTAEVLAQNAKKEVENYTWEKRAIKILDFLKRYDE